MHINPDIRHAATLPAAFYRSEEVFERSKERIFAATWQYVADQSVLQSPGEAYPFTLLPGVLEEPLVLTRDREGRDFALSNVCTHRGKIIVEQAGVYRQLSCGYHGRCFRHDGSFKSMPEFKDALDFPRPEDNLAQIPLRSWMGLLFVGLQPEVSFEEMIRPVMERIGWMPLDTLVFDPTTSKDWPVKANWALYCDNYLEGFHVPFVHPALNQALVLEDYGYELFPYCNLQLGVAKEGEPCFDIPKDAPDYGRRIYAYYYWLFPNLMLNFYPWGLSLNYVQPLRHDRCLVRFRTYLFAGAQGDRELNRIDQTELEDEAVVESVQLGVQSRYYKEGRFSPSQEKGVHHFHSLIARFMG